MASKNGAAVEPAVSAVATIAAGDLTADVGTAADGDTAAVAHEDQCSVAQSQPTAAQAAPAPSAALDAAAGSDESRLTSSAQLSAALLTAYQPDLEDSRQHLGELLTGQQRLVAMLQRENERFRECGFTYDVVELLEQVRLYRSKLEGVKKSMTGMHMRCSKLKTRSLKLKAMVEGRVAQAERDRQLEARRENQLVARMATQVTSSSTSATPCASEDAG